MTKRKGIQGGESVNGSFALRGLIWLRYVPTAYAVGFILAPLRDWNASDARGPTPEVCVAPRRPLFVPQGFNRIHARGLAGGIKPEEDSYRHGEQHCGDNSGGGNEDGPS